VRVNEKPATIIGVMPKGFRFPTNVDMWMALAPTPELASRTNRPLQLFGMLKPGTGMTAADVELNGIAQRLAAQYAETNKDIGVTVETFSQRYNGGNIRMIFLLMLAAVGFVLLIACANVANMMLSRVLSRQREMSIRTALGASRWRVVRQILIECVLLSALGGVAGLGLAALGVHWFDLSTQK
jgi:putative ABC transport system permease protein